MSDSPSTPSSTPAPSAINSEVTAPSINEATGHADGGNSVAEQSSPQETKANKAPTQQELKEAVKQWKLKSQGKERNVTDEAELVRLAQLGLGAHEKFEAAASTRKKAEAILEVLQKDPAKALQSLGLDVRKLAEEYLVAEAKKQMMSPDERQRSEVKQEIERLKAEKDQLLKEKRDQQISQLQVKYETDIQEQIIGAIDKYKLPKNPKTVARIAEYMANALENGYEATALDVATRVKQDLEEEYKTHLSSYTVEDLIKALGEDKLKSIRQYEVQKVKAKTVPSMTKSEAPASPNKGSDDDKPKKKQTMEEFQKELDQYLK